jgi:hypothetical protein
MKEVGIENTNQKYSAKIINPRELRGYRTSVISTLLSRSKTGRNAKEYSRSKKQGKWSLRPEQKSLLSVRKQVWKKY